MHSTFRDRVWWLYAGLLTALSGCMSDEMPAAPNFPQVVARDCTILRLPDGALYSVWVSGTGEVFAVGENGCIIRYDGNVWHREVSGTLQNLSTVDGRSDTVYAAGDGVCLQYDGNVWSAVPGGPRGHASAVIADDAGGVTIVQELRGHPIHHFDGTRWSIHPNPLDPDPDYGRIRYDDATGSGVADLCLLSSTTGSGLGGASTSAVDFFFDHTWSRRWTDLQGFLQPSLDLRGVWRSPERDVFAVGPTERYDAYSEYYVARTGLIVHFDGSTWEKTTLPSGGRLYDVWGRSRGDVYAVGLEGTVWHYDGTSWTSMQAGTPRDLLGVAGSALDDVYAVGEDNTVLRCRGGSWSDARSDALTVTQASDAWGVSANDYWVVGADGSGGMTMHSDGTTWQKVSQPLTARVNALWGTEDGSVFAVGEGGWVGRYAAGAWHTATSPTSAALRDVHGTSPDRVYAVGEGTILRWDGQNWSQVGDVERIDGARLSGVWCANSGEVITVGSLHGRRSLMLMFDGVSWTRRDAPTSHPLSSVWGSSPVDVYVAGGADQIYHYDGRTWSYLGDALDAYALGAGWTIAGTGPGDVWVVSNTDQMLHFDGSKWTRYATANLDRHYPLSAIWVHADGVLTGVGKAGLVLRYAR